MRQKADVFKVTKLRGAVQTMRTLCIRVVREVIEASAQQRLLENKSKSPRIPPEIASFEISNAVIKIETLIHKHMYRAYGRFTGPLTARCAVSWPPTW